MLPIETISYCFEFLHHNEISLGVCKHFDNAIQYRYSDFIKKYSNIQLHLIIKHESYEIIKLAFKLIKYFKIDYLATSIQASLKSFENIVHICNQHEPYLYIPRTLYINGNYDDLYNRLFIVNRKDLMVELAESLKDWYRFGLYAIVNENIENLEKAMNNTERHVNYIFYLRTIDYEKYNIFEYLASKNITYAREAAIEQGCMKALNLVFEEEQYIEHEDFNFYYKLANKQYVKDFLSEIFIVFNENNYLY